MRSIRPSLCLQVLCLCAAPLLILWGFPQNLDYQSADEVNFLMAGRSYVAGNFDYFQIAWHPLYAMFLAVLDLIPWPWNAMDVSYVLVPAVCGLSIWWALRSFVDDWIAFFVAIWFTTNPLTIGCEGLLRHPGGSFEMQSPVSLFGLTLLFAALGLIVRRRPWSFLLVLSLIFFTRAEAAMMLVGTGAWLLLRWRQDSAGRAPAIAMLVIGLACVSLLLLHQSFRSYSFMAFHQHWSATAYDRMPAEERETLAAGFDERRFRQSFPTARSTSEAILENPVESLAHICFNALRLPHELFRVTLGQGMEVADILRRVLLAFLIFLVAWATWRNLVLGVDPLRAADRPTWGYLLSGTTALPVLLLVSSWGRYVYPLVPLTLTAIACFAQWQLQHIRPWLSRMHLEALLPVVVLVGLWVSPSIVGGREGKLSPRRETIRLLRENLPDRSWTLFGSLTATWTRLAGKKKIRPVSLEGFLAPDRDSEGTVTDRLVALDPDLILIEKEFFAACLREPQLMSYLASRPWLDWLWTPERLLLIAPDRDPELTALAKEVGVTRYLSVQVKSQRAVPGGDWSAELEVRAWRGTETTLFWAMASTTRSGRFFFLGETLLELYPDALTDLLVRAPNTILQPTFGSLKSDETARVRFVVPEALRDTARKLGKIRIQLVALDPHDLSVVGSSQAVELKPD